MTTETLQYRCGKDGCTFISDSLAGTRRHQSRIHKDIAESLPVIMIVDGHAESLILRDGSQRPLRDEVAVAQPAETKAQRRGRKPKAAKPKIVAAEAPQVAEEPQVEVAHDVFAALKELLVGFSRLNEEMQRIVKSAER